MSNFNDANHTNTVDQGEFIKTQILKYLRYWFWFGLSLILALSIAYLYLRYTPKIYTTNAKIKILNKAKGLELPSAAFVFNRSNINLENEIEIIKSYEIIEQVADSLDLTVRFFEEGNVLTTEINQLPFVFLKTVSNDSIYFSASYRVEVKQDGFEITASNTDKVIVFPDFDTTKIEHNFPFELSLDNRSQLSEIVDRVYIVKFIPLSAVTLGLRGSINVSMLGKNTDILRLNYSSQSKAKNERILNTLIWVFNEDGKNDRKAVWERTVIFIDERFEVLAGQLDSVELDIQDYKQQNNLITLESDAELGMTQRTLSEQQLFDLENQLILADLLKESLETPNSKSELLPANIGLNSTGINGLVDNYNTLVLERDNLITSAGENNPSVLIFNEKLQGLKSNIFASIESYVKQLAASKAQMMQKNRKFASKVYSLPEKEKKMTEIIRQREIWQTLYLFLLQKKEEAQINLAVTEPSIKTVEKAISSGAPISPNSRSTYLMALFLGILVPFGVLYLIFMLDTKVHTKKDIERVSRKVPVIGEIPHVKDNSKLIFDNPNDSSVLAESFRILSANVEFVVPISDSPNGKVIFCTSTIKGEGKTYVSMNLSLALSSMNKKVLLIGADLRNPQIHSYALRDKNSPGLSNYLHDTSVSWQDILIKGFKNHKTHDVLLSGAIPPNPTSLLTNGRFKLLLKDAKKHYDYIVVDTAPTILVTDTMLISDLADVNVYVVKADFTEKKLLDFSKDLNETNKLKNMAYVLNNVGSKRAYGYGYNYGYGYGYNDKS